MHRKALVLALFAGIMAAALSAQTPEPSAAHQIVACLPSATIDQIPKALDEAISGPGDKDRTCLRQLMQPDVRLVLIREGAPRILTLDDWIEAQGRRGSTVLIERQIKVRTETYGRIAHLWCTFEIAPAPEAKATNRGLNSIQAIFDGERWKVVEVLWQAETPAEPIPEKYLP